MACGLTIITKMDYRGDSTEEYSNTYWLTGAAPSSPTNWRALFDAMVAQQKTLISSSQSIIGGYGYDSAAANAVAVWSVDLNVSPNSPVAGTFTTTGLQRMPGDVAAWIRWGTSRLNSRGKRIYLRKYFHPAWATQGAGGDGIAATWTTALSAFGLKLRDASFLDARTLTDKNHTDVLIGHGVSTYMTTRTLKRRGKRPTTP